MHVPTRSTSNSVGLLWLKHHRLLQSLHSAHLASKHWCPLLELVLNGWWRTFFSCSHLRAPALNDSSASTVSSAICSQDILLAPPRFLLTTGASTLPAASAASGISTLSWASAASGISRLSLSFAATTGPSVSALAPRRYLIHARTSLRETHKTWSQRTWRNQLNFRSKIQYLHNTTQT